MKRLLTGLIALVASLFVYAGPYYFLSEPDISPDGTQVVFCYNGDIWQVATTGGTAHRLTAMAGTESWPRISPDGKWLAFTGSLDGNANVYVMPMAGGVIKQLTFCDSSDKVDSWAWDSREIYFTSNRYNDFASFTVSKDGGTPHRLFAGYFNNIHGISESPLDGTVYFTDTWESLRFADRKGYKGEFNPDIKTYNFTTDSFKTLTHWEGKDFDPIMDRAGTLYFISDQCDPEGGVTNLYTLKDGKKVQLTDFKVSVRNPRISADDNIIVFEKGYQLFLYNIASGQTSPVNVTLFSDPTLTIATSHNVKGKITNFDVSPDNKKLAFVSRGELFVSDIKGKFVKKLNTAEDGRVSEVKWLKDSDRLIFNQTVKGWQNWFTIKADGTKPEKELTQTEADNRNITLNHDYTKAVYLSGLHDVNLIDLTTMKVETLTKEELWGFNSSAPQFSPDDAYVVFTAYRNFEQDIFLYNIKTKKTIDMTNTGISESDPMFSSDGKYLYFSSDRINPSFPRGTSETHIYRIALEKFDTDFRSDEFNKLFKEEKKGKATKEKADTDKNEKKKEPAVVVKIDFSDLLERFELISPDRGDQFNPYVITNKEVHHVLYASNHVDGKNALYQTTIKPFKKRETKPIKGAAGIKRGPLFVSVKSYNYVLINGTISSLNLGKNSLKKIDIEYPFTRNMRSEFNQMFDELWAGLNDNYYDKNFHGRNWTQIREKYKRFLPYVTNRNDLRKMINDMLGELNSSHMGFYSSGKEEKTFYDMTSCDVGIVFNNENPYEVENILKESPMDKVDKGVEPGDTLTAVNGVAVNPEMNRERYFSFPKMPDELSLTFHRENRTFTLNVHPESFWKLKGRLYNKWEADNQQRVDSKTDKQIAYVHMKDMGTASLKHFLIEMTSENYQRKGLILDLRNNMGGNVHDAVLQFLSQKLYAQWKYRGGPFAPQPNFFPASKPIVLLVNKMTLSDGEMTAAGFKALKLGKIVGTETYRWLIFTSGKGLVDGSFYRLPCWGCYTLDGIDIEHTGVTPDYDVKNTVRDKNKGLDPQLDKAIQLIMEELK